MRFSLILLVILGIVAARTALACETTEPPEEETDETDEPEEETDEPEEDEPEDEGPGPDELLKGCFGEDIEISPLEEESGACEKTEGDSPEDLKCDFESFSGTCCFCNEPGKSRKDQLDWVIAKGEHDHELVEQCFGQGAQAPLNNFLVTYRTQDGEQGDSAILKSCSVCAPAGKPIKVSLKHWILHGKMSVCMNPNPFDSEATPTNCQRITAEDSGPSTLTLPAPTEEAIIDIVILGEATDSVSILGIDDLEVIDFEPGSCGGGGATTEGPGGPGGDGDGKSLDCDFEEDGCAWEPVPPGEDGAEGEATWEVVEVPPRFGNRDTGVKKAGGGKSVAACNTDSEGDVIMMRTQEDSVKGAYGKTMKFKYYESTRLVTLMVCADGPDDCEEISDGSDAPTLEEHKDWQEGEYTIPDGVEFIAFVCENTGGYIGTCAIDDIKVS